MFDCFLNKILQGITKVLTLEKGEDIPCEYLQEYESLMIFYTSSAKSHSYFQIEMAKIGQQENHDSAIHKVNQYDGRRTHLELRITEELDRQAVNI